MLCSALHVFLRLSAFDVTASVVMTIQLYSTFDHGIELLRKLHTHTHTHTMRHTLPPVEKESVVGPMMATFLKIVSQLDELTKQLTQALNAALTVCDVLLANPTSVTSAMALKGR